VNIGLWVRLYYCNSYNYKVPLNSLKIISVLCVYTFPVCKYIKGAWSECDANTNMRTRELQLKRGDPTVCLPRKQITKKCKKRMFFFCLVSPCSKNM
jgi:hypothetical protein